MNKQHSEFEEKTISCINSIKGKAFTYEQMKVRLPNGKVAHRDIIRHSGAAAVLAMNEQEEIYLVRQYRKALDMELLEIPAGKIDHGETPILCAKRELKEEIGAETNLELQPFGVIASAVGFSDERIFIYLAEKVQIVEQKLDEDEFLAVEKYPIQKIIEMIDSGEIIDAKTVVAVERYIRRNSHKL